MTRSLTGQPLLSPPEFPFPRAAGQPPASTRPAPPPASSAYRFYSPRQRDINLPSSPFEFTLDSQRRQRSQPGSSRAHTPRQRSPLSPLQPLSPLSGDEALSGSPEPSPTSPAPGEYRPSTHSSRYTSRPPSFGSYSSRRPSTDVPTPEGRTPPAASPYLDSPYYPASPVFSYRRLHPEPCFHRILERRAQLRDPTNRPALLNVQEVASPATPVVDMANAPLKRKVVILGSPSVGE